MGTLVRGGRVVTAVDDYFADVLVEGDRIVAIGRDLGAEGHEVIDASGLLVLPGGIDPHTHFDMPYGPSTSADDFRSGTRAAAVGGTTTILDFPTQERGRSTLEALDTWREKAEGKALIDYGFHMILTDMDRSRLTELDRLVEEGLPSFKMFTAYPDRLLVDDGTLYRIFRRAGELGATALMHAENGVVIDEIIRDAVADGKLSEPWHARTRPTRMEAEGVYRSIAIAEVAEAPLYVVHLSCADALVEVMRAQDRGVDVVAETCPQYLVLDDSLYELPDHGGARYVMTQALRQARDQGALWRGLAQGRVSTVGTDHCPFHFADKLRGKDDFTRIPNGGPGVENRMSVMFHAGVLTGRLSLNRYVEVTSTAAAKAFGMFPRKGTIAVGSDADILLFDPEERRTVSLNDRRTHHMQVDYSAYEGWELQGWTRTVLSRGRVIVRDGALVADGGGRFIHRARRGDLLR